MWPIFPSLRGAGSGWRYDLVAGLTLAAIAIPEQMATSRLGGFPPEVGFFGFIAGSLAFAALGSNRFLSSGADSTITPIFAGSLAAIAASGSPHYYGLASFLALLVGTILIVSGLFRAGWIADLLSVPVTTGFLAGISAHIVVSQLPALLGLPSAPGNLFFHIEAIARHIHQTNLPTLAIGLGSLATIVLGEKISARIPSALIALVAAALAVRLLGLDGRGVATLGAISGAFPQPSFPQIDLADVPHIVGLAVTIAVVIMVQTAATSRAFTETENTPPDINRDFLGVGIGNALAGLFGAFPVDASPPRTAIVAETGGRSQLASITACIIVAALVLLGAGLLAHVPNAALAGVLLFIAGRIFRLHVMNDIYRKTRGEFALVVVTMLAVVALPVQTGVSLSILLSLLHGVWTATRTGLLVFERLSGTTVWWPKGAPMGESPRPGETLEGVLVAAFQAPLSFLNAYDFRRELLDAIERNKPLKLIVLEAGNIVEIDYTAARILAQVISSCRDCGVDFAIARLESVRAQAALDTFGVSKHLGENRVFRSVDDATRSLAPDAATRVV